MIFLIYTKIKFDTTTLVIEKDNISFKRNYTIEYQQIKLVEEAYPLF